MINAELYQVIVKTVNEGQGFKGVELVLKVMERVIPKEFSLEEYNECIEFAVNQEEILEIEYFLPQMPDRIKSFYLPAGTSISPHD